MNIFAILKSGLYTMAQNYILADPNRAVAHYRKKGVTIGEQTELYNTHIDSLRPFLVTIGSNTLITGSTILTHDASTKKGMGYTKLGKVTIGDNVFIGIKCIILPNVKIGNNVIVGAGTVVSKDIPDNTVAVGSPMRFVGSYDDFIAKNQDKLTSAPQFEINYNMSDDEKQDMIDKLDGVVGFLRNK